MLFAIKVGKTIVSTMATDKVHTQCSVLARIKTIAKVAEIIFFFASKRYQKEIKPLSLEKKNYTVINCTCKLFLNTVHPVYNAAKELHVI